MFVAKIFALLSVIIIVSARPSPTEGNGVLKDRTIPILRYDETRDDFGQYALRYVSGDGTTMSEQGSLKITSNGNSLVLVKQGSISYYAPDGTPITLEYVADENGYRPIGSHIPTQPTLPIVK